MWWGADVDGSPHGRCQRFRFRNLTELFGLANTNTQLPELNDEYGNSIWKNRVDSWKDKKSKKKKKHAKATKAEDPDAQVPPQQHMEDISLNTKAASATDVLTYPKTKITSYRIVIIMRLTILALFLHYRITHPVDSAYGLWLTSVICEIWFAFPWVLDQFRKWTPINRETYIDRLSARFEREGETSQLAAVDFFVSTVDPLKEPPLITANTVFPSGG